MANTYTNAAAHLTDLDPQIVYTCPAGTTAIIKGIVASNLNDTLTHTVTVEWNDNSAGETYALIYRGLVPVQSSLQTLDVSLVLEENDSITITADIGADSTDQDDLSDGMDVTVSILELT